MISDWLLAALKLASQGGGILRHISDREVRRPFVSFLLRGSKLAINDLFGLKNSGGCFMGGKSFKEQFLGIFMRRKEDSYGLHPGRL